ncbi:MAG: heme-binding protein [Alphaproteobacteria bacterium]|nr:heme-binding protein [Alphaproteobacteria bacterium]
MKLEQADIIIEAIKAEAQNMHLKPLTIVVLSADGTVRASIAQTGASPARFAIARGKAEGALTMRCHSRKLAEMAEARPEFFASLNALEEIQGIVAAAGALLVKDSDGALMGSVGISGDTSDNDEACAEAAITAAGLELWQ